ncbi:hypothetical protein, partial [Mesorhizobium sp. M7A.F.Ca.US.006.01.1.1]|uniref:hypothetical protein n=1 Tax=Mesorhizobium sp. M7A.F.Ca.US.006.01.1.1 TaxID=2496707 RepID=UPI0019D25D89
GNMAPQRIGGYSGPGGEDDVRRSACRFPIGKDFRAVRLNLCVFLVARSPLVVKFSQPPRPGGRTEKNV